MTCGPEIVFLPPGARVMPVLTPGERIMPVLTVGGSSTASMSVEALVEIAAKGGG